MKRKILVDSIAAITFLFIGIAVSAQTTSFVFQGKLSDSGLAASGAYQFQFRMYDAASNGNQIGQTLVDVPATVSNGIFAVNLDFGSASFNGAARYIEVGVRLDGSGQNYTVLNPRQLITSTPYSVKSLKSDHASVSDNSLNLGGIPANQYIITTDTRLSDDRNPLPGSANYIQNSTNTQALSNFSISGEGKANVLNATQEFRINNIRAFHLTGTDNTFVGSQSGNSITSGSFNSFFGFESGKINTIGFNNTFAGAYAGRGNTTGTNNAFFGANAGLSANGSFNAFFGSGSGISNTDGANNSYFGNATGVTNGTGDNNSFFGSNAGKAVNNVSFNSFFGSFAGEKTTTGAGNTFIGAFAGRENMIGFNNTFIGYKAGQTPTTGNGNVLIGYNTSANSGVSNSIAIGQNITLTASNTIRIGNGSTQTSIPGEIFLGDVHASDISSSRLSTGEISATDASIANSLTAGELVVEGVPFSNNPTATFKGEVEVDGQFKADIIRFGQGAIGGNTPLCVQIPGVGDYATIIRCTSSRRYKDNIQDYTRGLEIIRRLRPVTFNWKVDGSHDVGFIAEEVNEVEPLLNIFKGDGTIDGVRYAQITTALVNSVKEQQTQIEKQTVENQDLRDQLKQQQMQIDALKALVCQQNPAAAVCAKPKE